MAASTPPSATGTPGRRSSSIGEAKPRWGERLVYGVLFLCALVSVVTTVAILFSFLSPSIEFFKEVPFSRFFSAEEWAPAFKPPGFGVLRVVVGTLNVTLWALLVAIPLGLGAAIYLAEYASQRTRRWLKPTLEVLEGVPTVAYGFFALTFVTPILRDIWPGFLGEQPGIFSAASAGVVLGLMIIPTVASISEDAMSSVPAGLREASYGLGASKLHTATKVVVPAALSGIVAACVLAVSRAIGETMVVLIAAGNTPNLTFNPAESIQTMTAFIANTSTGDIPLGTTIYYTVFAVGALLFLITFVMNMVAARFVRKYREVYE